MDFQLAAMTEEAAKTICSWSYEPPYDIYSFSPWETLAAENRELADPRIRKSQYCAVVNEHRELCGFAQFFPLAGWLRLGLGMRPDLCGKGLGASFVRAILAEAHKRKAPADQIDLEVLPWNERAIRVYEKCGFVLEQQYERMTPLGPALVHCMVYRG
ncbi:MAG TPA: GNAT family protein [Bacilli bacterium]